MAAAPYPAHAAFQRFARAARFALLVLPLVLALAGTPVRADAVATVLPADGLRLRAAPSTDAKILDIIPGGTRIALVGSANADGWYPALYRGQRGWVLGQYLGFDELDASVSRRAVVVPPDGLNLRAAPSTSAEIFVTIGGGTAVVAGSRPTDDGWVYVFVNDHAGWVNAAYLSFDSPSLAVTAVAAPVGSVSSPASGRGTPVGATGGTAGAIGAPPGILAGPAGGIGAPLGGQALVRYYSADFEGSPLACGGIFHADDASVAASNSWPCGTQLRICTGLSCLTVTVRDRGGMAPGEIDLSVAGFQRLGALNAGQLLASVEVLGLAREDGSSPQPAGDPRGR